MDTALPTLKPRKKVKKWYVLCDSTRVNAQKRAYHTLQGKGFKVFTPMKWVEHKWANRTVRVERPVIPDLLIVHTTEESLAPYIKEEYKLHYRIVRGSRGKKMTVNDKDMRLFMRATSKASSIDYYKPEEYDSSRIGEKITIKGGAFDGKEGILLDVNGTKKKKLVVRLANLFVAVVELNDTEDEQ